MGGAQAVAALAYGTATIRRVDKIVGPGNVYVALAKRLVFGDVGIDLVAGPSEVVVVADARRGRARGRRPPRPGRARPDGAGRLPDRRRRARGDAVAAESRASRPALPRAAIAGGGHPGHGAVVVTREPRRGARDREPPGARALWSSRWPTVRVAAGGPPRGGDLPRRPHPRGGRRLPGGPEPRPADGRDGALRLGLRWRTSSSARASSTTRRPASGRRGRTSPRSRRRRGSTGTARRPGSAWTIRAGGDH